ncbi:ribonuclease HI [Thalassospira australica]|uniref:ribonuclease HI n=1 Tax=Thalassospira australica TaxID=1528106 RepID=UPI001EE1ABCE|nr:ribonuclease HI [Thalassospira australica]
MTTMTTNNQITIYTDGSCTGNPGPGGYAAIIFEGDRERIITGSETETTNNRMELSAAIAALKALDRSRSTVRVVTDSQYLSKGMTTWISDWKAKGWRGSNGKAVKNTDLWRELDELSSLHDITWEWVRGHSGDELNERVDALASRAIGIGINP